MGYDMEMPEAHFIQTHARAFFLHPDFSLDAAIDPDESKRNRFIETYNCPAFSQLSGLPLDYSPDIVVIATPTITHKVVIEQVLSRFRPSIILCEKPLGGTLQDAQAIVQACKNQDCQLYVNYIRSADPGVRTIKHMLESKMIHLPVKGVAWYSKGLIHNGSHFVNLLEFLFGPVVEIQVFDKGRLFGMNDPEPGFVLHFEKACITFQAAWEEFCSYYAIQLMSPSGLLNYAKGGENISWQVPEPDPVQAGYFHMGSVHPIENGMAKYQWHVTQQLALASAGKPHTLCNADAALETHQTLAKILESSRSEA